MMDYIFERAFTLAGTDMGRDAFRRWFRLQLAKDATCREVLGVERVKRLRIGLRRIWCEWMIVG